MLLLPLLLLAIMGLSVAPVAGIHEGWAYYSHGDIAYQTPDVVPGPITLRIWVGWLRSHDSFRDLCTLPHGCCQNQTRLGADRLVRAQSTRQTQLCPSTSTTRCAAGLAACACKVTGRR